MYSWCIQIYNCNITTIHTVKTYLHNALSHEHITYITAYTGSINADPKAIVILWEILFNAAWWLSIACPSPCTSRGPGAKPRDDLGGQASIDILSCRVSAIISIHVNYNIRNSVISLYMCVFFWHGSCVILYDSIFCATLSTSHTANLQFLIHMDTPEDCNGLDGPWDRGPVLAGKPVVGLDGTDANRLEGEGAGMKNRIKNGIFSTIM